MLICARFCLLPAAKSACALQGWDVILNACSCVPFTTSALSTANFALDTALLRPLRPNGKTMELCLSHFTAFRALMRIENALPARRPPGPYAVLPKTAVPHSAVRAVQDQLGDSRRIDLLVSSPRGRRNDSATASHSMTMPMSAGAFRLITLPGGGIVHTCGPELVFMQLAAILSIEEAIYISHALCSTYRIDNAALGGISHREGKDKPLASVKSLARFLDAVPGFCGCAKARRALAYVHDGARSPMESALAMGFSLPVHYGGFGLGEVQLNQPIRLFDGNDSGSRRFVTRIPDLTISARSRDGACRSVLVDFDADSVHASRKGLAKDAARRNQMATIDVAAHFSLSTAQVLEFRSYAHAAEQIRIALQRQNPLRASAKSRNPRSVAKYYQVRERQIALWKKVVCYSDFRKLE